MDAQLRAQTTPLVQWVYMGQLLQGHQPKATNLAAGPAEQAAHMQAFMEVIRPQPATGNAWHPRNTCSTQILQQKTCTRCETFEMRGKEAKNLSNDLSAFWKI
jgi:hypothetical protein